MLQIRISLFHLEAGWNHIIKSCNFDPGSGIRKHQRIRL